MAPHKKTVAIIGGGVAGLVSAKSCLEAGLRPTVFERAPGVGGMWGRTSEPNWQALRTNLSKFSCAFSDHAWPQAASMFPTRLEVGDYLSSYYQKHLQNRADFHFETQVEHVHKLNNGLWCLRTSYEGPGASQIVAERTFEHLIVASGFFTQAKHPDLDGLTNFKGRVTHSSDYSGSKAFVGQRTAVLGSSISAIEMAAEIAQVGKYVVHIAPQPFWVVPRYICDASLGGAFVPLDLAFYRRWATGPSQEQTIKTPEAHAATRVYLQRMSGELEKLLPKSMSQATAKPPFLGISDSYPEMLASGCIEVKHARATRLGEQSVHLSDGSQVDNIDNLVLCTGYQSALDYLDPQIRATLQFDGADTFMPLLAHKNVFHPDIANFAMVGMYRGPYFGVMEAQARWVAQVFAGAAPPPSRICQQAGIAQELAIKQQAHRPQFPHHDYIGLMDDLYRNIGMRPTHAWQKTGVTVVPAHYVSSSHEAEGIAKSAASAVEDFAAGQATSVAVFRALQGKWQFERTLQSHLPTAPSGRAIGTADFASRQTPCLDYREAGQLTTAYGACQFSRSYRYQLNAPAGTIAVSFASGENAGNHFHTMSFGPVQTNLGKATRLVVAQGEHLCGQDHYHASYAFEFAGNFLSAFTVAYRVQGPAKDYTSDTRFCRPTG